MSRPAERERARVWIRGAVQGVGFRPFVYRLATELGLSGWVSNSGNGVTIEAEGPAGSLHDFLVRLDRERPPRAVVQGVESSRLDPFGYDAFEIRASSLDEGATTLVLPDIATCPDCLSEVRAPSNRRFRYPFTNCTNCGPRFTIVVSLPYDRSRTTMAGFDMCPACRAEYEDPRDRRFHAQPNACPVCGPRLALWDRAGRVLASDDEALREAGERVRGGQALALKGLGGFQLIVDARHDGPVQRLRESKAREEKPFALMVPSIEAARALCVVSDLEERLLLAPEAPIVLLERRARGVVSQAVAPGNPMLGVMLPYTPLHHLLLGDLGFPVVATSGNLADEPICIDEGEALTKLSGLADVLLVHDRPIERHVDDSIARVVLGRELLLRRARGYAPLPVRIEADGGAVLGVGPHLKNSVALSVGPNVFVSQHIGDLETMEAYRAFERVVGAFERLYETSPEVVACDAHPDYLSTRFARASGRRVVEVQHHVAHVLACMADNELDGAALGVAWDGAGYGLDGTIWGGEFFEVSAEGVTRAATLRTFPLPGGDQAIREPRRSALGALHELPGLEPRPVEPLLAAFDAAELSVLTRMMERGVNSPRTSSVGRLFDAVASLVGVRQRTRYEGQAAMELEFAAAASGTPDDRCYQLAVVEAADDGHATDGQATDGQASDGWSPARLVVDWAPMLAEVLQDVGAGCPAGVVAAKFHHGLAAVAVEVARRVGQERVVLSGGCFQNRYLTEHLVSRLREAGFRPYWHQRVPPNDGGISLGQVVAAKRYGGVYVPGDSRAGREHQRR